VLYLIICRALLLYEALNTYAIRLKVLKDKLDIKTFKNNYLNNKEWNTLSLIKDHLEVLFRTTKDLKGNIKLKEGARKASYSTL
jgi:hypothetical protein